MPDRKEIKLQIGTNVIQTGADYDWDCLSVQGDDYMEADVSLEEIATDDGSYELRPPRYLPRYIDLEIRSKVTTSAQIDATELLLKSYMDAKASSILTIYKNGVERIGYGRIADVKKRRGAKWNEKPYILVTFVMPDPWFVGELNTHMFRAETPLISFPLSFIVDVGLTTGVVVSGNDIMFTVGGHESAGFILTLTASGAVVNPKVANAAGDYVTIKETLADGDIAVISTMKRDKYTTLNGVVCRYDRLSEFFALAVGSNTLTVSADSGVDNLSKSLTWRERYRG